MPRTTFVTSVLVIILASLVFPQQVGAAPPSRPCGGAIVNISFPQSNSIVSGLITVSGTVTLGPGADYDHFELHFSSVGRDAWVMLTRERREVLNGALGRWNTASLPDGPYSLRLRAVDRSAQYCEAFTAPIYVQRNGEPTAAPPPTNAVVSQPPTLAPNFNPVNQQPTRTPRGARRPTDTPTATPIPPTATPAGPTPVPTGIPTIAISIPTDAPPATFEPTETPSAAARARTAGASIVPFDFESIGASVANALSDLASSFVMGMKLTASVFLLIGVVVFLRRTI